MSATLASLRIRNLALVEDLTWEPSGGFVAITGETGAGKSVLIGALALLLGERGDKGLIRSGAEGMTVEAAFEGVDDERVPSVLDKHGAEPCEDGRLLIKRSLLVEGAGRQFVNGSPTTLALLRELGDILIDLHGPHDHQSLFSRDYQTRVLDTFGDCTEPRERFTATRRELLKLIEEKQTLLQNEQALAREIDLLSHQVREIETARPSAEEEESLSARQKSATHAQRIGELSEALTAAVSEAEDSLLSRLGEIGRLTKELGRLDPQAEAVVTAYEGAFAQMDELSATLAHYTSRRDAANENLEEIEARLDVLQTLKRKYGPTMADVIAFGEKSATRLADLQNREARKDTLDQRIAALEKDLLAQGKTLGAKRQKAAGKLGDTVRVELKDLGFAKAEFKIELETLDAPAPHGMETAEFVFAPNIGEAGRPLRSIASSGEISRVMLALKGALAHKDDVPILVFDEIDANVGGEIAGKVGRKMAQLARDHQVLCITHLPQVAASAGEQFIVTKETKGGRSQTSLVKAEGASRESELARMLGGQSASALAHARSLLTAA